MTTKKFYASSAGTIHVLLILSALLAALAFVPSEETMGNVQRILYIHVAVAWFGLLACIVMGACSVVYLIKRSLEWDVASHAANEIGWLCSSLTLITGSLWARAAWGTWWTWEPRLTSAFLLWAIYSSCLMVRRSMHEPRSRARIAGALSILGALDVPLIIVATRMFRGMHPESPDMEPAMLYTLLLNAAAFTGFFTLLFNRRRMQLISENLMNKLENDVMRRIA